MSGREPLAAIFGLEGTALTADERDFFRDAAPAGFILFNRNIADPAQVRRLVAELRASIGRADAPILIDQEGGRVARLRPPYWRDYPSARSLAALGGARAAEAVRLGARLIADDLAALGITVDCLPVLDVPVAGADPVIGDRAYGDAPDDVARLGRAACEGLLAGGVLPVIKHIPGHGRATVDSHLALPRVSASAAELETRDFVPFRALRDMPWAMTAHVLYASLDGRAPATLSPLLIGQTIRKRIGFDGILISDDLSMQALPGGIGERASGALAAGCDLVLHCNGRMAEMIEVADAASGLTTAAEARLARGAARLRAASAPFERSAAEARFAALLRQEG